jgi:catechol 2,3-dioxygenase-like lactoylglutathione lyase family enzyme
MPQRLAMLALLVRDYDEAIAYYTGALGFELLEDTPVDDKRWVRVRPHGGEGADLLLARAATGSSAHPASRTARWWCSPIFTATSGI